MPMRQVESVSELKKIVSKPQINLQSPLYERAVTRKISVRVTWLLLHTDITANQVTLLQTLFGILGFLLLCHPHLSIAFLGILAFQFGFVLDCVDGEIARYRKASSVNGILFDFFNHVTVIPLITIGLGFRYQVISEAPYLFYALVAMLGGLFSISPLNLASNETILYLLEMKKSPTYDYSRLKKGSAYSTDSGSAERKVPGLLMACLRWTFSRWGDLARYPGSMNVISLFVLAEMLLGRGALKICLPVFAFYTLFTVIRECILFARSLKNNAVEVRYNEIHRGSLAEPNASRVDS